jgi:hypothetical protein
MDKFLPVQRKKKIDLDACSSKTFIVMFNFVRNSVRKAAYM